MLNPILAEVQDAIAQRLLGKSEAIKLALCAILARGHILIEDLPGMGKTTLAHSLAQSLGLQYARVQFTSDLLPADILGLSVFDARENRFEFHPGPVFSQVLLADEINRATPRTQSALLEAMAEGQVSIDGETRALPEPFIVIATQNPSEQMGTYPLPESQLDRFLIRMTLGYPDSDSELALFQRVVGRERQELPKTMPSLTDTEGLRALQIEVDQVSATDDVLHYVSRLVQATRNHPACALGLSPRGGLALLAASKAWAYLGGRRYILPDDVQAVFSAVAGHRLVPVTGSTSDSGQLVRDLLVTVDVLRQA
jgi:MoxR-like ATPase